MRRDSDPREFEKNWYLFIQNNPTFYSKLANILQLNDNHTDNASHAIFREGQRSVIKHLADIYIEYNSFLKNKQKGDVQ